MADYTDGLGWAKLDATAACYLADCIKLFRGKSRDSRVAMLLYCFSKLNGSRVPVFWLGYRQIAKACGVSKDTARAFLNFCDKEFIFNTIGETPKGKTPKRTFYWLDPDDERCGVLTPHPDLNNPPKTPRGCGVKRGESSPHQIQSIREGESSKSDLSPRASSVYANAPTDARQKEQTPADNEIEEKEYGFVDTKDIQPGPDAVGVPQDEFDKAEQEFQKAIDEALAKNSFTGANKADFAWRDYRRAHKPISGDV